MSTTIFSSAWVLALLGALALGGCASFPADKAQRMQALQASASDNSDPLEPMNRVFLQGNLLLYQGVERPIGGAYRAVVPQMLRDRVSAGVDNLSEPRIFINDLLQGRGQSARNDFRPLPGEYHLRHWRPVRLGDERWFAAPDRRLRPDPLCLGLRQRPVSCPPGPGAGQHPRRHRQGRRPGNQREHLGFIWHYGGPWPAIGITRIMALDNAGGVDDVLAGSLDPYPRLRSLYLQKRTHGELGDAFGNYRQSADGTAC